MSSELVTKQMELERRMRRLELLERPSDLLSPFLDLPGQVGIWYAGNVQRSTGNIYDSTGQGRTLTYNGNPTINYQPNGIAYVDLDGSGDYWSRADETDLDISGTESWAINPGLTIISWYYFDSLSAIGALAGKALSAANGYLFFRGGATKDRLEFYTDGAYAYTDNVISINTWYFCVAKYIPSTERSIIINKTKYTDQSGAIPASIGNNAAAFEIGAYNGGTSPDNAKFAIVSLHANALSDAVTNSLFEQTRSLFGV